MEIRTALRDILAGSAFIAFGLAFAALSLSYEVGTPLRMGPGYFPLALGGLLVAIGILIIGKGFVAGEGEPIGAIRWRAVILIVVAIIFFGVTVRGLGVAPSIFVAVLLSGFAGHRANVATALLIAVGLTVGCIFLFIVALQLRLPLLGPWVPI